MDIDRVIEALFVEEMQARQLELLSGAWEAAHGLIMGRPAR